MQVSSDIHQAVACGDDRRAENRAAAHPDHDGLAFGGGHVQHDVEPADLRHVRVDRDGVGQQLGQARPRAVEEGLPVVRAANNGISAVIDSYGRVRNALGLGEQGVVDAPLPVAIDPPPFALIGPTIGLVMALLGLLSAMHGPIRRRLGANS